MEKKLKVLDLKPRKKKVHPLIVSGALPQNVKEVGDVVIAKWNWWFGDPYTPIEIISIHTGMDSSILEWMDVQETVVFCRRIPGSSWYLIEKIKIRYIPIKESPVWEDHIKYYAQVLGIKL